MKILIGLICAIIFTVVGTTEDAQAYYLGNSTTVAVNNVFITTTCGTLGPYNLAAGMIINVPIPAGCTVTGILYQSIPYTVGYYGPVPPPNPPNNLIVTIARAVFLM